MPRFLTGSLFWSWLVGICVLALYSRTLCPTVYVGDSGELALAAARLQIAHPPGYPLLTNLGYLWTQVCPFLRPILALNLLAALYGVLTVILFYWVLIKLLASSTVSAHITAAASAIALAAGATLWSAATNFEVYSLSALLTVLVLYSLIQYRNGEGYRWLLLCFYLLGLGLTNHLSIVSLLPAIIVVAIPDLRKLGTVRILSAGALLLLPITLYLYLPLRSRHELAVAWYNPQTLAGFRQQVFAEPYQRFIAEPVVADIVPYLWQLWQIFSSEMYLPWLLVGLAGLALVCFRDRVLAVALWLVLLTNCALNFNYTISDIAPYYLPSIIVLLVGVAEILGMMTRTGGLLRYSATATIVVAAGAAVWGNFERSDLSQRTGAEMYALDLFERAPEGGILFCATDNSMFPALYLRYAENYRPDSDVYGHLPTLVRLQRDLGMDTVSGWTHFPDLLESLLDRTERPVVFARELLNYENDFLRIVPTLQARDLIYVADSALQIEERSYHLDWLDPPQLYDPKEALLFALYYLVHIERLEAQSSSQAGEFLRKVQRLVQQGNDPSLNSAVAAYYLSRGQWAEAGRTIEDALTHRTLRQSERVRLLVGLGTVWLRQGDLQKAERLYLAALELDPLHTEANFQRHSVAASVAVSESRFDNAIRIYREMLSLAPDHREIHFQLGLLYIRVGEIEAARQMLEECLNDGFRITEVHQLLEQLNSYRHSP